MIPTLIHGLNNIISVSEGEETSVALTTGQVYVFGGDNGVQLSLGDSNNFNPKLVPILILTINNIVAISTSGQSILLLNDQGQIYVIESNIHDQLGLGADDIFATATLIHNFHI